MGRLRRHRKIKSCDPFYRGHKTVDISCDAPVDQSQVDYQATPQKAKYLFQSGQNLKSKARTLKKSANDGKELKHKLNFKRRPGETKSEYYQRLDKQAALEVNRILVNQRHVSQKRKEFLKARKKKKNRKQWTMEGENVQEFATDTVRFGEVVNEPPALTFQPKNAKIKARTNHKISDLLSEKNTSNHGQSKNQNLLKPKTCKHLSAWERQRSDRNRLNAINAYRQLKKTKRT